MRIAFFGGSFDPPHRGHLAVAQAAADRFTLDEVLFAPVARQPLKEKPSATSFVHRYAMTALATQSDARFVPSLLDAPQNNALGNRPNYTVDTLERLRSTLAAETHLFTLLGADSWLEIARWHDAPCLLSQADWIVAARPGFSLERAERALPPGVRSETMRDATGDFLHLRHADGSVTRVFFLPNVQENISATELRARFDRNPIHPGQVSAGKPGTELLPTAVWKYIEKTGLYRQVAPPDPDGPVSGTLR